VGLLRLFEKRPFSTSAKFVATLAKNSPSIARPQDGAFHNQFQRADALEQERPRDSRFYGNAYRRWIVGVKPNSATAQLNSHTGACTDHPALIGEGKLNLELEFVAAVSPPVAVDDLDRHLPQSDDRPKPGKSTDLLVPGKTPQKYYPALTRRDLLNAWSRDDANGLP
jgi:hypothetical protein